MLIRYHARNRPTIDETVMLMDSGAGTNLKVEGTHPARSTKIFFLPLYFFGSTSTSSRFGQYSLVSLLFAVLFTMVPPSCPYGVGAAADEL